MYGQEFSGLDDGANIFKLIGPVLVKQDKSEAIMAVGGRLEFIEAEMCAPPSIPCGLVAVD
jgi:prefoldin beta subunit